MTWTVVRASADSIQDRKLKPDRKPKLKPKPGRKPKLDLERNCSFAARA